MAPSRSSFVAISSLVLLSCGPASAPVAPVVIVPPAVSRPAPPRTKMDEEQAAGLAQNPPGIRFTIAFADGKSRFVMGEPIRIELSFSSDRPSTYQLDGGLYDRVGRLSLDEYVVEPNDAVDPLADYFEHGLGGLGGIRQMPVLGEEPHRMTFELNEWKRFDVPGHHRLFVRSERIGEENEGRHSTVKATSNILEFDIDSATPEASARALADATARLDRPGANEDERRAAARALRFLGTEAAALEMVRRFASDDGEPDFSFGLIGSPHRATIVRAMDARIDDASAVSLSFMNTLALLRDKMVNRGPRSPEASFAQRAAIASAYAARLAFALPNKPLRSRAACVSTLLELAWMERDAPPSYLASTVAMLPSVFRELSVDSISRLLEYRWTKIAGPAMAPVLREIADDKTATAEMRGSALRRLLELDPAGARARIVAHLRTGEPSFGIFEARTAGALPDATLPELDGSLAARLEKDPHSAIAMVARYATAAIRDRVKAVYTKRAGRWDGDFEGHFLGYFMRVDPAFGAREAAAVLAAATGGAGRALAVAADDRMTPELEKVLVAALDARDASIVYDAIEALRKHGSAAAGQALWRRLERFHTEWAGRASELRHSFLDSRRHEEPRRMEQALGYALITGRGWLCDRAAFARLQALLVSDQEKDQAASRASSMTEPIRIDVTRTDDGEVRTSVAQYELRALVELEAKLAQFPRGTRFRWSSWGEAPSDFTRVKRTLDRLHMTIER